MAVNLEAWTVQVKHEKAVYHTLNKLSVDVTRKVPRPWARARRPLSPESTDAAHPCWLPVCCSSAAGLHGRAAGLHELRNDAACELSTGHGVSTSRIEVLGG